MTNNENKLSLCCHGENRRPLYRRDGARAWLVCFCTVICNIVVFGCTKTFGIVYPVLLQEFDQGKVKIAWVGSLLIAVAYCLSLVAAKLINRFGTRFVGMSGGAAAALGYLATSFINRIEMMYLTYSFVIGLGAAFCYLSNIHIIRLYFKRRLGLATGFTMAGIGASYMVMSPIIEILVSNVGWRNAFRAMSGMALIGCACAASFSPHVEKDPEPQTQSATQGTVKSLVKNVRLLTSCLVGVLFYFGMSISMIHFGQYAEESGCTLFQVAMLYIGFGVCTVIGRIAIVPFMSIFHLPHLLAFISLLNAIAYFLCPFSKTFLTLLVNNSCSGFCDGCFATVIVILIPSNTVPSQSPQAFGLYLLMVGLTFAISPPAAAFIAETTGSYTAVFNITGSILLLSAIVCLVVECIKIPSIGGSEMILVCEDVDDEMLITEKITVL